MERGFTNECMMELGRESYATKMRVMSEFGLRTDQIAAILNIPEVVVARELSSPIFLTKTFNIPKSEADAHTLKVTKDNISFGKYYESADKMVSHPSHYQSKNGLEVIDAIKAFTEGLEGIEATDTGNIIKYACRWKKKNGIQDLEKIMWYTQHLINHLKEKEGTDNGTEN